MPNGENVAANGAVNSDPWEEAYQRFETPEEETRKFVRRLRHLGATTWAHDAAIVELFCGRGNGLHALETLGFTKLEGVDLSPTLARKYAGRGRIHVADCRALPFDDASKDIAIVQGGLHHLPDMPGDLAKTLSEVRRILRPGGLFVAVEPWLTPFLHVVHGLCDIGLVRRASSKFDALATMIDHERRTYMQWLEQPAPILDLLKGSFAVTKCETRWGKLQFVGKRT